VSADAGSIAAGPVDFYAGAIAATAIILFGKFVTHRSRHAPRWWWQGLHVLCSFAAGVGLIISLANLSQLSFLRKGCLANEVRGREIVLVASLLAGAIFALDVAWAVRGQGSTGLTLHARWGPGSSEADRPDREPTAAESGTTKAEE
jgi:hypothetical protein